MLEQRIYSNFSKELFFHQQTYPFACKDCTYEAFLPTFSLILKQTSIQVSMQKAEVMKK